MRRDRDDRYLLARNDSRISAPALETLELVDHLANIPNAVEYETCKLFGRVSAVLVGAVSTSQRVDRGWRPIIGVLTPCSGGANTQLRCHRGAAR